MVLIFAMVRPGTLVRETVQQIFEGVFHVVDDGLPLCDLANIDRITHLSFRVMCESAQLSYLYLVRPWGGTSPRLSPLLPCHGGGTTHAHGTPDGLLGPHCSADPLSQWQACLRWALLLRPP
mgnify:CR=1 FL=1